MTPDDEKQAIAEVARELAIGICQRYMTRYDPEDIPKVASYIERDVPFILAARDAQLVERDKRHVKELVVLTLENASLKARGAQHLAEKAAQELGTLTEARRVAGLGYETFRKWVATRIKAAESRQAAPQQAPQIPHDAALHLAKAEAYERCAKLRLVPIEIQDLLNMWATEERAAAGQGKVTE